MLRDVSKMYALDVREEIQYKCRLGSFKILPSRQCLLQLHRTANIVIISLERPAFPEAMFKKIRCHFLLKEINLSSQNNFMASEIYHLQKCLNQGQYITIMFFSFHLVLLYIDGKRPIHAKCKRRLKINKLIVGEL